jgi:hypothetical protein
MRLCESGRPWAERSGRVRLLGLLGSYCTFPSVADLAAHRYVGRACQYAHGRRTNGGRQGGRPCQGASSGEQSHRLLVGKFTRRQSSSLPDRAPEWGSGSRSPALDGSVRADHANSRRGPSRWDPGPKIRGDRAVGLAVSRCQRYARWLFASPQIAANGRPFT